jgi:hypothetical protein
MRHRPRSSNLLEELAGDPRIVIFRSPSRYARWKGAWRLALCMLWIACVAYTLGSDAVLRNSRPGYFMTALYLVPAGLAILYTLPLLWSRRSVIIDRAEGTISETFRSPFKTRTVQYRLDWVRCVRLTYWNDDKTTWYVGVDVGSDHRIQMGDTPRQADARHLCERLSQVLGVPLRDQSAEVMSSAS